MENCFKKIKVGSQSLTCTAEHSPACLGPRFKPSITKPQIEELKYDRPETNSMS